MSAERIRVDLLGTSFHIQAEEDPQYLREVVETLREHVEQVRREARGADPLKLALLTGLNLVDELLKAQRASRQHEPEDAQISQITERLIERIDASLTDCADEGGAEP